MPEAAKDSALDVDEGPIAGGAHDLEDVVPASGVQEVEVVVELAGQPAGFGFQGIQCTRDLGGFGG
jgi:hypothetical protein